MNRFARAYSLLSLAGLALGVSACNGAGAQQLLGPSGTSPAPGPASTLPAPVPTGAPAPAPTPSATPPDVSSLYTGPAEVAPYVQKFVEDAAVQGRAVAPDMQNPTLEIQLADLSSYGSSVIGLCEQGTGMRRVTFQPGFWASADETQRMILVHHELGHCVLYRAHRTDLLASGAEASIMYPSILSDATYDGNSAYYQQELFARSAASANSEPRNSSNVYICDQKDLGL